MQTVKLNKQAPPSAFGENYDFPYREHSQFGGCCLDAKPHN